MRKMELDGRIHARKTKLTLLHDEWRAHPDDTVMWSPLYGEVRIDDVETCEAVFYDSRNVAHTVDAEMRCSTGERTRSQEEMLRPDMDRSVLWDYVGATYMELKAAEGADMASFRKSLDAWTGVPAREAEALGLWRLAKRARDYGDSRPCLLVKPSRQGGVLYVLDAVDDAAAYDWVEGHCGKACKPRKWRCRVELRKTYCVAVGADTEEDAVGRLHGMGDAELLDLMGRHATGLDCEPEVRVYADGETERIDDPDVTPDYDMDLDEVLKEEGE